MFTRWQESVVRHALGVRRVVHLTGARQCGKTTRYFTLADELHRRFIIERVLQRGELADLSLTIAHYTMSAVVSEAQQMRSLDLVAA